MAEDEEDERGCAGGGGRLHGACKSGCSSGHWRLESGLGSHAGGCKTVGNGVRTEAVGAELIVMVDRGRGSPTPPSSAGLRVRPQKREGRRRPR